MAGAKNICFFIISLNDAGGTQRVTSVIANELVQRGYKISIVCWMDDGKSFYPLQKEITVFSIYKKQNVSIYKTFFYSVFAYRKIISRIQPDVIIDVGSNLGLLTFPALAFKKIKRITWEHFNQNIGKAIIKKITNFLINNFGDKVVVLTNADAVEYKKIFKENKVAVIYNPVTIDVHETASLTKKNVLAIGRLTYQKGFDILLQAWQIISKEKPDWTLTIVGGGEEENKLKQLANDLQINSSVHFIPPTKDIQFYYKNASIQVMSSRYEGLPLVLIEGKAFGLPTISFDCRTGPREVITNGCDGELVAPENVPAFAEAVIALMNDPERLRRYAKNSLQAAEKFDAATIVNQWEQLFKSLFNN